MSTFDRNETGEHTSPRELQTQQLVESLAEEACLSLFEAYGVPLERSEYGRTPSGDRALTAIIGFTGVGITGMCLVAASEEPLLASIPVTGALRDWIAELSNQLAGRLKHKLLAHGAEVYVTTPIVLRATRIEPLPRRKLVPRAFSALGGTVALWVEVEISPEFKMVPPEEEQSVAEGETLLF
jgi:hypothetical protein